MEKLESKGISGIGGAVKVSLFVGADSRRFCSSDNPLFT